MDSNTNASTQNKKLRVPESGRCISAHVGHLIEDIHPLTLYVPAFKAAWLKSAAWCLLGAPLLIQTFPVNVVWPYSVILSSLKETDGQYDVA